MEIHTRPWFGTVCAAVLVLACLNAGCASSQIPVESLPVAPAPAETANAIAISNFAFSPATLTVRVGTTVTWTNKDSVPHTVVSDAGSSVPFTSPSLATGSSFPFTFTQAGTYTYHCSIHPSMKGTVVVEP
jgi:amicyanin